MTNTVLNLDYLGSLPPELLTEVLLFMTPMEIRTLKETTYFSAWINESEDYLVSQFFKRGLYAEEDLFFRSEDIVHNYNAPWIRHILMLTIACFLELDALDAGCLDNGISQRLLLPPSILNLLGRRITDSTLPPGTLTPWDPSDWMRSKTSMKDIVRLGFTSFRRAATFQGFTAHCRRQYNLVSNHGLDYLCLLQALKMHIDEAISISRPHFPEWFAQLDEIEIRRSFMAVFRQAIMKIARCSPELGISMTYMVHNMDTIQFSYLGKVFSDLILGRNRAMAAVRAIRASHTQQLHTEIDAPFLYRALNVGEPGIRWRAWLRMRPGDIHPPPACGISWTPEEELWYPFTQEDCEEAWVKWGDSTPARFERAFLLGMCEVERTAFLNEGRLQARRFFDLRM